jgi:3,4-dihydroxy 2-butanone 4-phosphate synthase/GTP cyclohydrolase II
MSEEPIHFTPISEALVRFREGSFLVVMDDEDRENEGDLILAARFASPEQIAFALRYTSGILCAPLTSSLASRLELHPMTLNSTDPHRTAFTVSIDHVDSTTGVSGLDRSRSFKALAEPNVKAEDFRKPGHIFPLVAKDGGVRQRRGHTEASLDLCRLSEVGEEVGLLAELMNEDGTMKVSPFSFSSSNRNLT